MHVGEQKTLRRQSLQIRRKKCLGDRFSRWAECLPKVRAGVSNAHIVHHHHDDVWAQRLGVPDTKRGGRRHLIRTHVHKCSRRHVRFETYLRRTGSAEGKAVLIGASHGHPIGDLEAAAQLLEHIAGLQREGRHFNEGKVAVHPALVGHNRRGTALQGPDAEAPHRVAAVLLPQIKPAIDRRVQVRGSAELRVHCRREIALVPRCIVVRRSDPGA